VVVDSAKKQTHIPLIKFKPRLASKDSYLIWWWLIVVLLGGPARRIGAAGWCSWSSAGRGSACNRLRRRLRTTWRWLTVGSAAVGAVLIGTSWRTAKRIKKKKQKPKVSKPFQ